MTNPREVKEVWKSKPTLEGAGVRLKRAFGYYEVPKFDPFLLLDHFGSDNPNDYMAGFPWHPHRGIETITYMLEGEVKHGDSLGNSGIVKSGDVQWMTAGSGIIHEEMPRRTEGLMQGFQLWANLPASHKMMNPRYRDITHDQIPEVTIDDSVRVKIVAGKIQGKSGPVKDIVTDPEYMDVKMSPKSEFHHSISKGHNAFAYLFEGQGFFDMRKSQQIESGNVVIFGDGENVAIITTENSARFLLVSGKPLGEPVAWRGPIVMNTQEELRIAFDEFRAGTFIKQRK